MANYELKHFSTAEELSRAVASAWLDEIALANRAGKTHCVALSGGRIAQKFFTATVEQGRARAVSFVQVHFFWADERCVPPTDAESNFKLAQELLLAPLDIADHQIHRLRGEWPSAEAVTAAIAELASIVPVNPAGQPMFDLIFLGLGEDGHVASLFPVAPGEVAVGTAPFLAVNDSPKPPPRRISLSYTALAAAGQVWLLAAGAGKEKVLRESLTDQSVTPLARVLRSRRRTKIFAETGKNNL